MTVRMLALGAAGDLPDLVREDIVGAHRFPPVIALQNAVPESRNLQPRINKY